MALDFSSPFYPYSKVPNANNTLKGAETIPYQLLRYLLDLPSAEGYAPTDDNSRPRVRLAKYLWYDTADPLSEALPTPKNKLSLLFNPAQPDINTDELKEKHPKGYRLFWQHVREESILTQQTLVKCYLGRIFDPKPYHTSIGVVFDILVSSGLETNMTTDVESRSFAIEQCIRESLSQINMTGIGAISFQRYDHADNGSVSVWTEGSLMGRSLRCSIDWTDAGAEEVDGFCDSCN
jgi:hypothetical protein